MERGMNDGLQTFAVLYLRGHAWDVAVPFHAQQGVGRHRDFLAAQHEAGRLVFGGPFLDDSGGLAVYRAASLDELEALVRTDATVIDGLLAYEIHPYVLAFRGS
jgi:uncharacterized protein YciI